MDYVATKHPSGLGSWLLILGCPQDESHELHDAENKVSGPSFASCASCAHQMGEQLEDYDSEADWSSRVFPERLKCGFCQEPI